MLAIKSDMGMVKKSQRNLFFSCVSKNATTTLCCCFTFAQHIATKALGSIIVTFTFARG